MCDRFYQAPSLQDLLKTVQPEAILDFLEAAALHRFLWRAYDCLKQYNVLAVKMASRRHGVKHTLTHSLTHYNKCVGDVGLYDSMVV